MKRQDVKKEAFIDARRRLDGQACAFLVIHGEAILERHIRLLLSLRVSSVHVLVDHSVEVPDSFIRRFSPRVDLCFSTPEVGCLVLNVDEIYAENSLKRIWTLRSVDDLKNAEGELERANLFHISRYTLRPIGKKIAGFLYRSTPVTATHVTWGRIVVGVLGAFCFLADSPVVVVLAGVCVLVSWLFDLTDGQLARLRSQVSRFGAYLDSVGDGVVDNLYYISIATSLYLKTGATAFLFLGLANLFGKYVFVNSTLLAPIIFAKNESGYQLDHRTGIEPSSRARLFVKRAISFLDDTDVRIHFLAVCAFLNAPIVALLFHVFYFNARWCMNLINAFIKNKGN